MHKEDEWYATGKTKIGNASGEVLKRFRIQYEDSVIYSEVVLLKSYITNCVLNNATSNSSWLRENH
jgi:hypothetical protein